MFDFFPSLDSIKKNKLRLTARSVLCGITTAGITGIAAMATSLAKSEKLVDKAQEFDCGDAWKNSIFGGEPCEERCLELCATLMHQVSKDTTRAVWISATVCLVLTAALLTKTLYGIKQQENALAEESGDFVDLNESTPLRPS